MSCHDKSTPTPSEPLTLKQQVLDTAASLLQSHKPLKNICAHLCAPHRYPGENRQIIAHHYCTHVSRDMHQCIIYDSDRADAKLIGIEYVISEKLFAGLDAEEKKYWHSHQFEVSSGLLVCPGVPEAAEKEVIQEIANYYGKVIHTWQVDRDSLPIGPPQVMMAVTDASQIVAEIVKQKDEQTDISTEERKKSRVSLEYHEKIPGADVGVLLVPKPLDEKQD